ncbi:hypothetical protein EZJ43_16610 [Pedobacter changchengzhani]|uniref:Uncharacterized protein n=1 Tax=Pedobacter changchengzhani TaxID=2529274 RepID=A0A4R5MH28_9SPHI|nr:hypothetical protein [Pedobacter changchengzhani]TDG34827.1 hypothetical protein EZJ43_16610 [Pedobacter changchengzhani]
MACSFKIKPKYDIEQIYQIALREIKRFKVDYKGDDKGGNFKLKLFEMVFKGKIGIEGNYIVVQIIEKPFLIPCSLIETSIKKYVADLKA